MTSDVDLQKKEDDFQNDRAKAICHYAAIFVVGGYERASAVKHATKVFETQQAAESDMTGATRTLPEAQLPQMPMGKEAQVHAIAQELYGKYF